MIWIANTISVFLYSPIRRRKTIVTNPKNNKTYEMTNDVTNSLLRILKDSVDGMNLVGFFIAGRGKMVALTSTRLPANWVSPLGMIR